MKKFQTLMKSRFENAKKDNKGFSLVELIIAVVILGIIAVVAIGGLYGNVTKSRINTDISNARDIQSALSTLSADKDVYKEAQSTNGDILVATWGDGATPTTANYSGSKMSDDAFKKKVTDLLSEGFPASKTNGKFKLYITGDGNGNVGVFCRIYESDGTTLLTGDDVEPQSSVITNATTVTP